MEAVAPPGFCNRGEVRYGSIGGLEYEVPQKLTHLLQCICRVIRSSSMTMKAHTYYIIFGRPPIGGSFPPGGATVWKWALNYSLYVYDVIAVRKLHILLLALQCSSLYPIWCSKVLLYSDSIKTAGVPYNFY